MQYYARNNIYILSPLLYTLYELLFPNFSAINSDGEVILTKFSDRNMENNLIDLSEYYDSDYSETNYEWSEAVNVPLPVISGSIQDNNIDFITASNNYLRNWCDYSWLSIMGYRK